MEKRELQTPAILVDLDILENNIKKAQALCAQHGKLLWPMIKTHKSTEIVKMQQSAGATGFLCGTLDECEALLNAGIDNIMYAYPVANEANIKRVINLAKNCNFFVRIDSYEAAEMLNAAAKSAGTKINYTIIIDSGLHRFGIPPEKAAAFADALKGFEALNFKGISTHPGHVYAATKHEDIQYYVNQEKSAMKTAVDALKAAGYSLKIIGSGSTPTFYKAVDDENINIYHPGNYVFMDNIQLSNGTARESDCALSVYATIISHPSEDLFICDAGSKCLGLDLGGHGNTAIKGYGYVKGHPELTVSGLSEEVGKLRVDGPTTLRIGDKIEIIPNHSCFVANLTSYLVGCRGDKVERLIKVDMRGNSTTKNFG